MICFEKFDLSRREEYLQILQSAGERGCEYSFANLNLWGRQRVAILDGFLVLFSQFEKRSVYPYPVGKGNKKKVLDAIIQDAKQRGILCRLSGLLAADCMELEELYPGKFRFHPDRDSCDYVYNVDELASLKGKKFQKKRNHLNKFRENHPNAYAVPLTEENLPMAKAFAQHWYENRLKEDPDADFQLEQRALSRAFAHREDLGLEGLILVENGEVLAMTMGSPITARTFDVHFEKAREDVDGAYAAINQAFAQYLQEKYPDLLQLNREDDMGIPGLRQAKLSYNPDRLVVKFWARLWEEEDED